MVVKGEFEKESVTSNTAQGLPKQKVSSKGQGIFWGGKKHWAKGTTQ